MAETSAGVHTHTPDSYECGHGYGWPCNVGDGGQHLSTAVAVTVSVRYKRCKQMEAHKGTYFTPYLLDKLLGAHFS